MCVKAFPTLLYIHVLTWFHFEGDQEESYQRHSLLSFLTFLVYFWYCYQPLRTFHKSITTATTSRTSRETSSGSTMHQNCIAPRPEENSEVIVQGFTDMSETQSKSVLAFPVVPSQPGLQLSMYPITLKVCVCVSLSLPSKLRKINSLVHFLF